MTNFPPVAFLIYKFVWAETLQKVFSGDPSYEKNLESQNDWADFSQSQFRRPRSPENRFLRPGQLARQSSVIAF